MRLIADRLTIERGGRRLAVNLSFTLAPGEAMTVVGRNGTGKSSLLRVIAGLAPPAAGRVFLDEAQPDATVAVHAHYLGHADALKGALTASENLRFWQAMLARAEDRLGAPPADALARWGLAHVADLPVLYLSAGQKRRLALARLLVARRPLWLLDEPTTALDAPSQQRFAEIVHEHLAQGGMVLAATHAALGLAAARELTLGGPA
jgi:heme exporter protein A